MMDRQDKARAVHELMLVTSTTSISALVRWMQERGVNITYHGLRRWMSRDDHPYSVLFNHLSNAGAQNDKSRRVKIDRK